jgi:hypothetical protein
MGHQAHSSKLELPDICFEVHCGLRRLQLESQRFPIEGAGADKEEGGTVESNSHLQGLGRYNGRFGDRCSQPPQPHRPPYVLFVGCS